MSTKDSKQINDMLDDQHELKTSWIEIRGHLLKCEEKLIQISNIQAVTYWIENEPPKPAEIDILLEKSERKKREAETMRKEKEEIVNKAKAMCIGGVIAVFVSLLLIITTIPVGVMLGVIVLFAVGAIGYKKVYPMFTKARILVSAADDLDRQATQDSNEAEELTRNYELRKEKAKHKKYLNLYLNSGWQYSINFGTNYLLLMKTYDCLSGIFEQGGMAKTPSTINIQQATFNGEQFGEKLVDALDSATTAVKEATSAINQSTTAVQQLRAAVQENTSAQEQSKLLLECIKNGEIKPSKELMILLLDILKKEKKLYKTVEEISRRTEQGKLDGLRTLLGDAANFATIAQVIATGWSTIQPIVKTLL